MIPDWLGKRAWHYTKGLHVESIVEARALRPATAGVPATERPAVWFSTAREWEATVGNLDFVHQYAGGAFRVGVILPCRLLVPWSVFVNESGAAEPMVSALTEVAERLGADPSDWWVSFESVPINEWDCVERWDGECWCTLIEIEEEEEEKDES